MPKSIDKHSAIRFELGQFEALAHCVAELGKDAFYPTVLRALSTTFSWQACAVARYSRVSKPEHLYVEGLRSEMVDLYFKGYYRTDPVFRLVHEGTDHGVYVHSQDFPDLKDTPYSLVYLPMAGWADILAVLMPSLGRAVTALFWLSKQKKIAASEAARLRTVYPLLLALHDVHSLAMVNAISAGNRIQDDTNAYALFDQQGNKVFAVDAWNEKAGLLDRALRRAKDDKTHMYRFPDGGVLHAEALPDSFGPAPGGWYASYEPQVTVQSPVDLERVLETFYAKTLTPREKEIVALILAGHTNHSIARNLGITSGGVRNHRVRLYAKLDITVERELFKLFLDHIMQSQPS